MAPSSTQSGTRSQTNGVLPVTASQTSGKPQQQGGTKPPVPRLKVIVRRLPPGMTSTEFTTIIGDEWKLGQGKVDWFAFKPGKDSKDPSKPSRPSRAYLHLTNESHLLDLSNTVRQSIFEDAQNTFTSHCLIGPPTVEFAPYGRTPGTRQRVDARAGTIDQDPEFMAFLEGLANPTSTKEVNVDSAAAAEAKAEKVTSTPLVQYLKEKKANKNKEAAAKAAKKQEAQVGKGKSTKDSNAAEDVKKKGKDSKVDKTIEKAAKDAVKILNREAVKAPTGPSAQASTASGSESATTPKLELGKVPGRQRGAVIAAHIRMLQRDLGLSPAQAHRQVRRDTADAQKAERAAAAAEKAATESKEATPSQPVAQPVPTAPKGNQNNRRNRGKAPVDPENKATSSSTPTTPSTPVILLKKPTEPSQPTTPTQPATKFTPTILARKPQAAPVPSEGATQAFVKHANPSQGVTEPLLKEAMEKFGAVTNVEIDKRKGFAYVDFADTDGLKRAMAANPINVAQGTVHVMQRKGTALPPEKKAPQQAPHAPRGGRGGRGGSVGRRGGRGGGGRGGNTGNAVAPSGENTKPGPSTPTGPAVK